MTLENWLRDGQLVRHRTSAAEIRDLREAAARDLRDCRAGGLSADWRLNIAYNAALRMATAALAAAGYRLRIDHSCDIIRSFRCAQDVRNLSRRALR